MKDYAKPSRVPLIEDPPKKKILFLKRVSGILKGPWVPLMCGLLLGLCAALIYVKFIHNSNVEATETAEVSTKSNENYTKKEIRKLLQESEILAKPQFEFYDILPAREIPIGSSKTTPQMLKKQFLVQVSSYQDKAQAQKIVQKLRQAQIDAHLTLTPSGWWRIEVGPLDSQREADAIRHAVQMQGMVGSLIREITKP